MSGTGAGDAKNDWIAAVLGVYVGGDDPPDEQEPVAADGDGFRAQILVQLRQVKQTGSANFGLVLGKSGAEHRMALNRRRPPRALGASLVRDTGLTQVTWGAAEPHPDRPGTLLLSLDGKHLPALCKKGNKMLRAFKPLPFARLALRVGGVNVDDLPSDDEPDDPPANVLPIPPAERSRQADTLASAAQQRLGFCEECRKE